ncbi:unnamed protein product [Cuscuta campestris]|uniref:MADS-box domain-containing protein n=1 Tax=Cuscuta campestris TaxID=132261 RepID=A0A484KPJ2_9ASTE|nr:unnamed protein product [Cuscuta campestris]
MAAEKQQQQQQIKEERAKKLQYEKRKSTLLKGGRELSILCGINVCLVVLSPNGKLETWPENLDHVRAAFRDAAQSNKRPRSDNNRKRRRSPSQVGIDDAEKGNKKMKAAISMEEVAGVLEIGKKTEEDHHHQLSRSNCCGNCYQGFPASGEWNNNFAAGIWNYENQIHHHHHHHQDCSVGYGGGGYSSSFGRGQFEFIPPTMAAEKQQQQQQIKEERTKKLQYEKRKSTLLKGAKELSILCGIDVCLVVLSPDGKLESWPENLDDVRAAFRAAAQSNKRPRSENNRKRRRSPSQVGIDDAEKGNKKMKADISDEFHAMGNNFKGEEEVAAGVLEMGKKTEEDHHHHHQLSLSNCCVATLFYTKTFLMQPSL